MSNYGIGGEYWTHMDRDPKEYVENNRLNPFYWGSPVATVLYILQAPDAGK